MVKNLAFGKGYLLLQKLFLSLQIAISAKVFDDEVMTKTMSIEYMFVTYRLIRPSGSITTVGQHDRN